MGANARCHYEPAHLAPLSPTAQGTNRPLWSHTAITQGPYVPVSAGYIPAVRYRRRDYETSAQVWPCLPHSRSVDLWAKRWNLMPRTAQAGRSLSSVVVTRCSNPQRGPQVSGPGLRRSQKEEQRVHTPTPSLWLRRTPTRHPEDGGPSGKAHSKGDARFPNAILSLIHTTIF